jgi:hypothetical protein
MVEALPSLTIPAHLFALPAAMILLPASEYVMAALL